MSCDLDLSRWSDVQARSVMGVLAAVSAHRERDALFSAIADAIQPALPFAALAICSAGPGQHALTPYYVHRTTGSHARLRAKLVLCELFETGAPVRGPTSVLPGYEGLGAPWYAPEGTAAFVALPLRINERVVGAVLANAAESCAYDALDLAFAQQLANAVTIALTHCRAYETISRTRDPLVHDHRILREPAVESRADAVTVATAMHEIERLSTLVARTDVTVLLLGETGVGKERLARRIHELSPRAKQPLVAINCAAIPSGLVESELFGHEPGAFTGASRRRAGRFEQANGGTLFLDEIGELPLDAQSKLLRVLQYGELERVGSCETVKVDVRVIAATNRDLLELTTNETFRRDLYFRLAVFPLELPPLWARRDEIPSLARQFIAEASQRLGRTPPHLDQASIRSLQAYSWPGNVRELQNVLERAVLLSLGGLLEIEPLLQQVRGCVGSGESRELRDVLAASRWVIEGDDGAAARLGIRPSTLRSRMRRLGIERRRQS